MIYVQQFTIKIFPLYCMLQLLVYITLLFKKKSFTSPSIPTGKKNIVLWYANIFSLIPTHPSYGNIIFYLTTLSTRLSSLLFLKCTLFFPSPITHILLSYGVTLLTSMPGYPPSLTKINITFYKKKKQSIVSFLLHPFLRAHISLCSFPITLYT